MSVFQMRRSVPAFIAFAVSYLLFSLNLSAPEWGAAVLTGAAAAAGGYLLRLASRDYAVSPPDPGHHLLAVLARVPADIYKVSKAYSLAPIQRTPEGRETTFPFDVGPPTAAARGRRGLVIWGLSLAPNAFVTAIDYAHRKLVLHQLLPTEASGDNKWPL